MGVASGVNPEDKPGDEDGPKLCSTSFCLLLQQRRYIAILASTFPLDNIVEKGDMLHGQLLISKICTLERALQ